MRVAGLLEFGAACLTVVYPIPGYREDEWEPAKAKRQEEKGQQPDETRAAGGILHYSLPCCTTVLACHVVGIPFVEPMPLPCPLLRLTAVDLREQAWRQLCIS